MKIAAVTDDESNISAHFGRAEYYFVATVDEGKITRRELRHKLNHNHFYNGEHHGQHDSRGHGFGVESASKHEQMISAITDCEFLLTRGMGRGAYQALAEAGITPVVTDIGMIEDALEACINGTIIDHSDRLH